MPMIKKVFRHAACLIAFFGLCCFSVYTNTFEQIRAGFFPMNGYHMTGTSGTKSGYGYELLQYMARYTDWKFCYTGYDSSFSECIDMLASGKIDILTYVPKTAAFEKLFDFSDIPVADSETIFTVRLSWPEAVQIKEGNFEVLTKMRIGMVRRTVQNADFCTYLFSHVPAMRETDRKTISAAVSAGNISPGEPLCSGIVWFNTDRDMFSALDNEAIEAAVSEDVSSSGTEVFHIHTGIKTPVYAVVKKGNSGLLRQINESLNQTVIYYPDFRTVLRGKFFGDAKKQQVQLTAAEKAYIENLSRSKTSVSVIILPDAYPLSNSDPETRDGIAYNILDTLTSQTGITFRIIPCATRKQYSEAEADPGTQITLVNTMNSFSAEQKGYKLTKQYYTAGLGRISRRETTAYRTVATLRHGTITKDFVQTKFSPNMIVYFDTVQECLEAVKTGECDIFFLRLEEAGYRLSLEYSNTLTIDPVAGYNWNVQIGVRNTTDPALYSIINKYVYYVIAPSMSQLVNRYTLSNKIRPQTWQMFAYRNPMKMLFVVVIFFLLIIGLVIQSGRMVKMKQKQLYLRKIEQALESAKKANTAKSDFMARMSHDMRTPMNAIISFALFGQKESSDEKTRRYFDHIEDSSKYLMGLINDVLDMQKLESGKVHLDPDYIEMDPFYNQIENMIKAQADKKQISLTVVKTGDHVAYAYIDRLRLEQILVNVLNNAVKYTYPGGKILWQIHYYWNEDSELIVRYTVTDNGVGISPEYITKIFEPFEQEYNELSRSETGTGLGLAIVKNLVTSMNGSISVTSERRKGSSFYIELPANAVSSEQFLSNRKQEPVILAGKDLKQLEGKRILLCEDNSLNSLIAAKLLTDKNMIVEIAEDGRQALELYRRRSPGYYDAVLMDIRMPVMDGLATASAIRASGRSDAHTVAIIAQSANAMSEDITESRKAGMDDYIIKPIDPDQMYAVLLKCILLKEGRETNK